MVFYFTSNVVQPAATLFMGLDKYESESFKHFISISFNNEIIVSIDEDLIKWGFPEDVWFHVDKMSSAHVYLRLKKVISSNRF